MYSRILLPILKTMVFSFVFILASETISAQSTTQALEGPALEKAIYFNKKSGLPDYNNICRQYTISCDDQNVLSKYSDQLMSDIRRIHGVVDCSIDAQNNLVIVRFPEENAKENREQNLEKIKSAMAIYNVKFVAYKEATYFK